MKYINRIVDSKIEEKMNYLGAILIRGPKWCGKTTSAKRYAKSEINLQDEDNKEQYLQIAMEKPSLLLNGEKPRLIDEWQVAPRIWNSIRNDVDKTKETGQYILTGSATPNEKESINIHPGTGRFGIINMKPLSLYESGESNGKISLQNILDGKRKIDGIKANITYEKLAYLVCRGGWPNSLSVDKKYSLNIAKDYIDLVCDSDISRIDNVSRNPSLTRAILKSYSREICAINSNEVLLTDVISNYETLSMQTLLDYLNALKKLFIIEEIPAWNPNIRSKTSIRTSPKKTFVDPSLACASLNISPDDLMYDVKTFGVMFENLANRDLSIYVDAIGGELKHFRDRYGLECDNVVHFSNGEYGLIETKLSINGVPDGEKNLLKILELIKEYNKVNKIKMKEPSFLMIIVGTLEMAYTTKNNILVVPIGCLKH